MTAFHAALALAVLGGIGGQLLLKAGSVGATDTLSQLARWPTLLGLAFYAASAMLYLIALRKIPVSIAFPSVAASYAIIAALGWLVWHEPMGWPQVAGIALICAGVVLLYQG
jgi:small multidrug resistance pump